jgi:hypothetical protein
MIMKTYTKAQSLKLKAKNWSVTTNSGSILVRAILKENALFRFQQIDSTITEDMLSITNQITF